MPSNLPALTLFLSTLSKSPSTLLPNLTIPTLLHLPENLGPHLQPQPQPTHPHPHHAPPNIRALILDKDNTFTAPNSPHIPEQYYAKLSALRTSPTSPFNLSSAPDSILIVSNTAGSSPAYEAEAVALESALSELRIPVFRQREGRRKPHCAKDVLAWLVERGVVKGGEEVAVVGDRIGTDVLMAGEMGGWSVWVREGVVLDKEGGDGKGNGKTDYRGWLARGEGVLERYLREGGGLRARAPWERGEGGKE
ncbi:hypothetical protein FQN54_006583 [Arachnomyces sp. PD_36]|nr:hypothetical protein FQN54_006583 [Arachnomyces sp. PD_36]